MHRCGLQFNGDTSLLPAVLDRSFWNRRTLPVKPVAAPVLPPVVLKTCNWGKGNRGLMKLCGQAACRSYKVWLRLQETHTGITW